MDSDALDKYSVSLENVRFEGQLLWQIFGSFLLAHTVFLAFILQTAFAEDGAVFRIGPFLAGLFGLSLCIPWRATYSRSSSYYEFRMAQARIAEPKDWDILRGTGQKFSEGNGVTLPDGTSYRFSWLARVLRTKRSVPVLIYTFMLLYVVVIAMNGPWWPRSAA